MTQRLAVVVTRTDMDETAAEAVLTSLGYRVVTPRNPSIQAITRKVPDLVAIDWSPSHIAENAELVQDVRANALFRDVPILVLHTSARDVPKAVLTTERLAAIEIPTPIPTIRRALEKLGALDPEEAPSEPNRGPQASVPWHLIHPSLVSDARSRFDSGHLADAVEAAFKAVNRRVKKVWLASGQPEKDGKALMLSAFSPQGPVIRLGDLSTESGRNVQEGYMHLFAGAMQGIRNPGAHDNLAMLVDRAWHLLMLASLLMWTLDSAGAA